MIEAPEQGQRQRRLGVLIAAGVVAAVAAASVASSTTRAEETLSQAETPPGGGGIELRFKGWAAGVVDPAQNPEVLSPCLDGLSNVEVEPTRDTHAPVTYRLRFASATEMRQAQQCLNNRDDLIAVRIPD